MSRCERCYGPMSGMTVDPCRYCAWPKPDTRGDDQKLHDLMQAVEPFMDYLKEHDLEGDELSFEEHEQLMTVYNGIAPS